MHSILQIKSRHLIKCMLTIDNTYEGLVYDGSPPLEEYIPDVQNSVWFILLKDGCTSGLVKLDYLNFILWVPHIFIYKEYRGQDSEIWGKMVAQEMREKYGAKKFLALTPYKSAKEFAERVGFSYVTTLHNSIKKDGKLLDQYMLEMS